jgi:hypothetical protein
VREARDANALDATRRAVLTEPATDIPSRAEGDDLFDVPVVAANVAWVDDAERAAVRRGTRAPASYAVASDADETAAPAETPSPRRVRAPIPMRRKLLWFTVAALALGDMALVAILFPERSSVPLPEVARSHRAASKHSPVREHAAPPVAEAPIAPEHAHPIASAPTPHETAPTKPEPAPPITTIAPSAVTIAAPTPNGPEPAPSTSAGAVVEAPTPATPMSARARLQTVELALDAGRRGFARVELGRILLELDALPASEREDARAQAEILVARSLQGAANEARRTR